MTREIKFRAWDKVEKVMSYEGNAAGDGFYLIGDEIPCLDITDNVPTFVVFMQFTGLKDKNGKEVYEGDIVKEDLGFVWEVYFDSDLAWFWWRNREEVLGQWNCGDDPAYPSWDSCEVIGNIYENPELLVKPQE